MDAPPITSIVITPFCLPSDAMRAALIRADYRIDWSRLALEGHVLELWTRATDEDWRLVLRMPDGETRCVVDRGAAGAGSPT